MKIYIYGFSYAPLNIFLNVIMTVFSWAVIRAMSFAL